MQTTDTSSLATLATLAIAQANAATTAVLNTNELLFLILEQVPFEQRVALRPVSKAWKDTLSKVGYAYIPISHDCNIYRQRSAVPIYPARTFVKIHPIMLAQSSDGLQQMGSQEQRVLHVVRFRGGFRKKLECLGGEFITSPPVTQMVFHTVQRGVLAAELRNDRGLRIGDMLKSTKKIRQKRDVRWVIAWFVVADE